MRSMKAKAEHRAGRVDPVGREHGLSHIYAALGSVANLIGINDLTSRRHVLRRGDRNPGSPLFKARLDRVQQPPATGNLVHERKHGARIDAGAF